MNIRIFKQLDVKVAVEAQLDEYYYYYFNSPNTEWGNTMTQVLLNLFNEQGFVEKVRQLVKESRANARTKWKKPLSVICNISVETNRMTTARLWTSIWPKGLFQAKL